MNRILVDGKLGVVKEKTITLNLNKDNNFLLSDAYFNKYVFNVKRGSINILSILKDIDNISFLFNIEEGMVSFNNFSINCKNEKIEVELNKTGALININNSFICESKEYAYVKVTHNGDKTSSNVYNCAVTQKEGSLQFNTITEVKKKKKGCKVVQDGRIISLNDTNCNEINPVLLIDEYEVDAKHSAFIGKFNEEEMFYLKSRGINECDAINLLMNGFLVGTMDICTEEKEALKKLL